MPSAKEAATSIAFVVVGVVLAAIVVRWGVANNIPLLKSAAI